MRHAVGARHFFEPQFDQSVFDYDWLCNGRGQQSAKKKEQVTG
jgi:hypothetical protein